MHSIGLRAAIWSSLRVAGWTFLLFMIVASCPDAPASDARLSWPYRNGPAQNGHVPDTDAQELPVEWSEGNKQNIRWKVALKDYGHSTPIMETDESG